MMDFKGMYEAQKAFRSRIDYKGSDRFEKLILALQVELGECANELPESFKFWAHKKNDLETALVEYVDGLSFILDLGIEIYFEDFEMIYRLSSKDKDKSVSSQFNRIFSLVARFNWNKSPITYIELISEYLILGELLGFSFEEIEEAYYQKNAVNHSRQNEGY
ncbi:dUTP diphosphatase [Cytobacillus horneckiae]|uniref:dUTP diphosphatase n=1 Tax=Cytobacillus horneckiae TaxID=549687 RepID=UPI003D9A6ECA